MTQTSQGETAKETASGSVVPLTPGEAAFVQRLASTEATGRLEDLEIEYWIGGGAPPPYHRSDQLRFRVVDGGAVLELNVATFDEAHPAVATIKYRASLEAAELRNVARLLRETGVFSFRFPEEKKPDIADILRTEVTLSSMDRKKSMGRTYYQAPPAALTPLVDEMKRITERLKKEGVKRSFDRDGKELR